MFDFVLSLTVLAAIVLLIGAVFLWRRDSRRQALLMALLAVIAIANVAIWTVPGADGEAPLEKVEQVRAK